MILRSQNRTIFYQNIFERSEQPGIKLVITRSGEHYYPVQLFLIVIDFFNCDDES